MKNKILQLLYLIYIYVVIFIQKLAEKFFFTQLYKIGTPGSSNGAACMRRKWTCIFVFNVRSSTVLILLEQYAKKNTCVAKNSFSLSRLGLEHVVESYNGRNKSSVSYVFFHFYLTLMLCYGYANLNIVTKSNNYNIQLLITIPRSQQSLSCLPIFKLKIWKHSYPSAPRMEKTAVFKDMEV